MKRILAIAVLLLLATEARADYVLGQNAYPVAPRINSVYASPMRRSVEIPTYGKNKHVYFRDMPEKDEGDFSGGGLYAFAAFMTGSTTGGMNLEHEYDFGSTGNSDMGGATGISVGFGRRVSPKLHFEVSYSSFRGMNYGDWTKVLEEIEEEVGEEDEWEEGYEDEDLGEEEFAASLHKKRGSRRGLSLASSGLGRSLGLGRARAGEEEFVDETAPSGPQAVDYYPVYGGGITSDFIGLGLIYRFDNLNILGTAFKPYIGVHFGYAMNTISDYTVEDADGWVENDLIDLGLDEEPLYDEDGYGNIDIAAVCPSIDDSCTETSYYGGEARFFGNTTRVFGYALELGVSMALESNLSLEFFYRMNKLGRVATAGQVLSHYTVESSEFYYLMDPNYNAPIDIDPTSPEYVDDATFTALVGECEDLGGEYDGNAMCNFYYDPEDETTMLNRTTEAGDLNVNVFGVKLKYNF
ncbi:MAG: hypothetical protein LBL52_04535 [Rickettsiales bacterium]|jgi:opacity protein-like surface antigen|nr:hypothetical protein [Rickettsiales bacterium]